MEIAPQYARLIGHRDFLTGQQHLSLHDEHRQEAKVVCLNAEQLFVANIDTQKWEHSFPSIPMFF